MKRLLQALRSKIFIGDIIKNDSAPRLLADETFTVEDVRTNGMKDVFVTYRDARFPKEVCVTLPAQCLTKQRIKTFEKEWDKIFRDHPILEVDKIKSLKQLCIDKNIGYLYDDLIKSCTIDQFQENMFLINKMLSNG